MKNIKTNESDYKLSKNKDRNLNQNKRFFRMLYTIYAISSVCFSARIFLSVQDEPNNIVIGSIISIIFIALALYFAYTAFIRKEGFEKSSLMTKIEYAAFVIVILQLILTFTDNPFHI